MVAREARRASPATTSSREARTWASSGSRAATSRTSRFTARVTLSRAATVPRSIAARRPGAKRPARGFGPARLEHPVRDRLPCPHHDGPAAPARGSPARSRCSPSRPGGLGAREAALRAGLDGLGERLDQLHVRLEATEQDLAMALSQTGVAEGLLLEKGIADADEVEDMRRRLVTDGTAPGDGDAIH